ncbi:hypothetical protein DFQ27_009494 [Actinomortierella ambigua]|uniref:Mitochondrial zinc maintenance protein 1, mitochondrial n=1 Tax=Actinomortierella ambigua TaxID=1343610 RepID=A0A9P6TWJ0_9FUNG|nr:hypothetical protein DFQ27_009494 [Actinomortierella ambigua]
MATRQRALNAYKDLLKAQRVAFRGDVATLSAAREKTYQEFNMRRNETNEKTIEEQLHLANQVTSLLRHNLVQGVQKKDRKDLYELKIREETELGDNETLREASKLRRLKNQAAGGGGGGHAGCGTPSCCSA